jgi:transcriptional regulator with XRE-family HTH domain
MSELNPEYLDITSALRTIRLLKGFTLEHVELVSNGEFTAQAVGSYERNSRTISLKRLLRLCEIYQVSMYEIINYCMYDIPMHVVRRRNYELRTTA